MSISATVVCDSLSNGGLRTTTLKLSFPSFVSDVVDREGSLIHTGAWGPQVVEDLLREQKTSPVVPKDFGAASPFTEQAHLKRWRTAGSVSYDAAARMCEAPTSVRPTVVAALLSPFMYKTVLATSGSWQTICEGMRFAYEPEVRALGEAVDNALFKSVPNTLQPGDWHVPYVDAEDVEHVMRQAAKDVMQLGMPFSSLDFLAEQLLLKISVARCAVMASATGSNREGRIKTDLSLFAHLFETLPRRRDYLEHQNMVDYADDTSWNNMSLHGRVTGWVSFRKAQDAWARVQ